MSNNIELVSSTTALIHGCHVELADWKTVIANKRACARFINSLKRFKESGEYSSVAVLDCFTEKTNDELSYYLTLAYIEDDRDACHVEAFPVFAQACISGSKVEEVRFLKDDCEITKCHYTCEQLQTKVKDFVFASLSKTQPVELVK